MGPGPRDKGRGDFRSRGPSVKRALARSGGVQAGRWGWKRPISQTAAIGHLEAINRVSITILCPLHPLHALLGSTLYGRGRQRLSPGQGYYNGGPGQHPLLFPLCEEGRSGQHRKHQQWVHSQPERGWEQGQEGKWFEVQENLSGQERAEGSRLGLSTGAYKQLHQGWGLE